MSELYRFHYLISEHHTKCKVLFLHGFMGSASDWAEQRDLLGPGCSILIPDLPGHGSTAVNHQSGYNFISCAEGITALLEKLDFYPVNLVGYSLGGRLAMYITLNWPHRIERLILESASPGIAGVPAREERRKNDAQLGERLIDEWPGFVDSWYKQSLFQGISENSRFIETVEQKKRNDPQKLAQALSGMGQGAQPSLWDQLKDIRKPVYLFAGALDSKYVELTQQMAEKIPHCKRLIFPGCSHNIHMQKPDEFHRQLKRIFSENTHVTHNSGM